MLGFLKAYSRERPHRIISFGGAFSNHLLAVAGVAHLLGIPSIGIVRSHILDESNPVIRELRQLGMKIQIASPAEYRAIQQDFKKWNRGDLVIPEGGAGMAAFEGLGEIWSEISAQTDKVITHTFTCLGTGTTAAALAEHIPNKVMVCAFSALKKIPHELTALDWISPNRPVQVFPSLPDVGFASYDRRILPFIGDFWNRHSILLDPIYTARGVMTLFELVNAGFFAKGSKVIFVHTGGLYGLAGYLYNYRDKIAADYPAALKWDANSPITLG